MEVRAIARDTSVSPRKARLIIDTVRGKKVDDALAVLQFVPSPAAKLVSTAIKSAAANAENNYQLNPSDLKVVRIWADQGHTLKRMRPLARGRSSRILKRSSHITVVVADEGE